MCLGCVFAYSQVAAQACTRASGSVCPALLSAEGTRPNSEHWARAGPAQVWGTSLAVQWLKVCLPMQGMRVQSLVEELRSHMLQGS